jgi:hypothetical protein
MELSISGFRSKYKGDFHWNIAYHPYPENLERVDFWNDQTATDSFDTKKITFKNIQVLTYFLSQNYYLFKGKRRHIILSEQGLNSKENEESEKLQAAAYCLAYNKILNTGGIDSFIYHSHVDNKDEYGLNLGLWRRNKKSNLMNKAYTTKPIYQIFRNIDGPERKELMKWAAGIIGGDNWTKCMGK